jgi:hypothetical protein
MTLSLAFAAPGDYADAVPYLALGRPLEAGLEPSRQSFEGRGTTSHSQDYILNGLLSVFVTKRY